VNAGVLVALTLPGLVILLVVVIAISKLLGRSDVSAAGLDVFTVSLAPGKEHELDQRASDKVRRADAGVPDPVDLEAKVARINRTGPGGR
jgi:hypothetical protein